MLTICDQLLPNNSLSYLAFRIACLDTLERMALARQFGPEAAEGFGFLTEVPFFRAVPPQVQLDVLSETWRKHAHRRERVEATLVDEAVLFAICETAARVAEQELSQLKIWAESGPRRRAVSLTGSMPDKFRRLNLAFPNEGDFLLISQFEDLPPFESLALKAQFGLEPRRCDAMFDVLGRWHAAPGFASRMTGLLTEREATQAEAVVKSAATIAVSPSLPQ